MYTSGDRIRITTTLATEEVFPMSYAFEATEEYSHQLDQKDPLSNFRQKFYVPDHAIYMDGNSLGLLSKISEDRVLRVLNEWRTLGIRGWLEADLPWFYMSEKLGAMCAKTVGALPSEVVATGTTTVNIHSLANTFYKPEGRRKKILADELNFPSDIYALTSVLKLRELDPNENLILAPSHDGRTLDEQQIVELMDEDIALVFLPSVLYRSGQLLDVENLTEQAHERGIPIGFDCSHSVGTVPHRFDEWQVDFALWCSYKYLNGGPGGTAFLYVNERHFAVEPALAGWFGYVKEKQFDMAPHFEHARSAGGWQISSPAILSSIPLEGSLRIILEAGIHAIRRKSLKMTSYLMFLVDEILSKPPYFYTVGTPREAERRGGHVAVEHAQGSRISEALRARGVIPDFRPPNIIRIAPSPLYNTYNEIWNVAQHLKEIIDSKEYERFPQERKMIS